MKYLFLLVTFFFGWFCSTPFEYSQATVQHTNAGRQKSGKSVHYQIKLVANKPSKKITFEKMWVGAEAVEFNVYTLNKDNQIQKFYKKGDTIYIDSYIRYLPNENGALMPVDNGLTDRVKEYQGQAVLEYTYKGETEELIIKNFEKLKSVNMP